MSRYRVGINAGPVHMSRRVGGGKKPLTSVLVWFIVKPVELLIRGLIKMIPDARKRSGQPAFPPPVGWHNTAYGPLWWNGAHWIYPDGRIAF